MACYKTTKILYICVPYLFAVCTNKYNEEDDEKATMMIKALEWVMKRLAKRQWYALVPRLFEKRAAFFLWLICTRRTHTWTKRH